MDRAKYTLFAHSYQHFEANCADYEHKILVRWFDAALELDVTVVVQQWSQIHPDTAGLQDPEKAFMCFFVVFSKLKLCQ